MIDTATTTATGSIPVGNGPVCVAVTPAGNRLYVTDNIDNAVSVIALTLVSDHGTTAGGTIVTPRGHDLAAATSVRFDARTATIESATDTTVTIPAVPSPGPIPATVITPAAAPAA
ncbi:hypothetical protein BG452_05415 [Streptomyces sp. CBMA123]|nr:hypothetical protein [Streptomyces sp. CBMA123]